jgi:polyferredoxin
MPDKRNLFRIIRAVGLLGLLGLILFIEWRFILGGRADGDSRLMQQLVAMVTTLMLPHFWVALALALVGHFGKRRIDKRAAKAEQASESPA